MYFKIERRLVKTRAIQHNKQDIVTVVKPAAQYIVSQMFFNPPITNIKVGPNPYCSGKSCSGSAPAIAV
jgi:hypothetical protein